MINILIFTSKSPLFDFTNIQNFFQTPPIIFFFFPSNPFSFLLPTLFLSLPFSLPLSFVSFSLSPTLFARSPSRSPHSLLLCPAFSQKASIFFFVLKKIPLFPLLQLPQSQ